MDDYTNYNYGYMEEKMTSYIYRGVTYHKRTWFYYIDNNKIQSIKTMEGKLKFKNQESICDYIDDVILGGVNE